MSKYDVEVEARLQALEAKVAALERVTRHNKKLMPDSLNLKIKLVALN